jgi:hypothetical protein
MSFIAKCPACGAQLAAPNSVRGKKVRCNKCDERFLAVPAADQDGAAPPAPPAKSSRGAGRSRRDAEDEDEAPRRKAAESRRPADEDDDEDDPSARRSRDEDVDEDEEPAKERKKRKRRRRPPVLVPALLGLGSLGLVAAALGIYFAFGQEKTPEPKPPVELPVLTESVMPDPAAAPTGPAAKGPPAPAPRPKLTWVEYTSPDGTFTAQLPTEPTRTKPMIQGPAGAVAANLYTADTAQAVAAILVFDLPGVQAGEPAADQALDRAAEALAKRLAGAKQVGRKAITHQGEPGREFGLDVPDGSGGTARVFLIHGRVYGLLFATKAGKPESTNVRTFFDGFEARG